MRCVPVPRSTSSAIALALALVSLAAALCPAEVVVVLYDVDFGSPPHIVGEPPLVGAEAVPRDRPTQLIFTRPVVEESVGLLDDQPGAFVRSTVR